MVTGLGWRSGCPVPLWAPVVPSAKSGVAFARLRAPVPVVPLSSHSHTPLRSPNSPAKEPGWQQCHRSPGALPSALPTLGLSEKEQHAGANYLVPKCQDGPYEERARAPGPVWQPSGLWHLNPLQPRHTSSLQSPWQILTLVPSSPPGLSALAPHLTGRWLAQCYPMTWGTQNTAMNRSDPLPAPNESSAGCGKSLPHLSLSGRGSKQWQLPHWIWLRLRETICEKHGVTT